MISNERPDPMGSESETEYCEAQDISVGSKTANITNTKESSQVKICQANYDRWKVNFGGLLDDSEGRKMFYEYLETEQNSVIYECWHSCVTYRQNEAKKETAKEVYSRFIRIKDSRVSISDQARNNLALRLRANNITNQLLLEVENEVYANLRDIWYPKFLKSDFFTFYCETFGQARYEPSKFHKFGKPSFAMPRNKISDESYTQKEFQACSNSHEHPSCLTPYEKERQHSQCNSTVSLDKTARDSHAVPTEDDKSSMNDTRYRDSRGYPLCEPELDCHRSARNYEHDRHDNRNHEHSHHDSRTYNYDRHDNRTFEHDQLADLPNFKPRTQRMNQEKTKLMKPRDFAALLTEKLEKVLLHQNDEKQRQISSYGQPTSASYKPTVGSYQQHYQPPSNPSSQYYSETYSDVDVQSAILPPATDRYSVAGASSHSGSGANAEYHKYNRNVKEKAKGLFDAVHHSLRNGLGECNCPACCERRRHDVCLYGNDDKIHAPTHNYPMRHDSRGGTSHPHTCNSCSNCSSSTFPHEVDPRYHRTHPHYNNNIYHQPPIEPYPQKEQLDIAPPVDTAKIYAWMEKSEKYSAPSPNVRRKKHERTTERSHSGIAGQPIAQDPGMPLLPQPDTGNVLEEVKRVLVDEPDHRRAMSKVSRSNSSRSHSSHRMKVLPPQTHYSHEPSTYSDFTYDNNSMASVRTWNFSDNQSSVSYNPSQISTVPSSASRLWNEQGYYDPTYFENRSSQHDSRKSHHDNRIDSKSDARSHSSAGRKSTHSSTRLRSDQRSTARSDHHSDVRSQSSAGRSQNSDNSRSRVKKEQGTPVTYFFGVEPIPYRIIINSPDVTLGKFKSEFRKGRYRFFFKVTSPEDGETVYEEFKDDDELLPFCNGKISGKVEKIE